MDAQPLRRNFSSADGYMLQSASAIHGLLSQDIATFGSFDQQFTAAFVSDFEALIDAARALASDDLVIDQVATKREEVQRVRLAANTKYSELRHFVLKAFPQSKSVQNQFGLGSYRNYARRSAARMLRLLQDLHKAATSYQAELLAAGYTLAKIAEIDTLAQQLDAAISAQSQAKKGRPKTTEERISALNACYQRMVQINAAAQMVYMTDAAKRKQYVFYPKREKVLVAD
jgi:hypothetical protein